jgi:hypothetical protein
MMAFMPRVCGEARLETRLMQRVGQVGGEERTSLG